MRSVVPWRSLIYGPFIPILDIADQMGLPDMLKSYLTNSTGQKKSSVMRKIGSSENIYGSKIRFMRHFSGSPDKAVNCRSGSISLS